MQITVFGANSIAGKYLVKKALAKGWRVTAFDRDIRSLIDQDLHTEELHAVKGYAFDSKGVLEVIQNADAAVSLIGGGLDTTDHSRSLGNKTIVQQMRKTGLKRIIVLGGYGILDADGRYVLETPDYPAALHAVAQEQLLVYQFLQASSLEWTMVCPATISDEDGKGQYITSIDVLPDTTKRGIAAGDLAEFILQELSTGQHIKQRVGIARR